MKGSTSCDDEVDLGALVVVVVDAILLVVDVDLFEVSCHIREKNLFIASSSYTERDDE